MSYKTHVPAVFVIALVIQSWCSVAGYVNSSAIAGTPLLRKVTMADSSSSRVTRRLGSVLSWFAVNIGSLLIDTAPITMFGTTFTADNYQREMIDFLVAGRSDDNGVAMRDWYLKGTGEGDIKAGVVRAGPGPNTKTHLGFNDVEQLLTEYPSKILDGSIERGNELGMQVLGSGAWPEAPGGLKTIGLGQTRENHAFVRPYLANALDKGGWSDAWLQQMANVFFDNRDQFDSSDVAWWVLQVLHKIHLDLDIDEAQAKEFTAYMSKIITLIPFTENALNGWAVEQALSVKDTLSKKAAYLESIKSAMKTKYADEDFVKSSSDDAAAKLNLLASNILDSLQFAGGISVPTVINTVLATTHMATESKHTSLKNEPLSTSNYLWILLEALRKYAPVAGVPSWEKKGDGNYKHVVPNLAQALMDSSVFDQPLVFKNRGADVYESKLLKTGMPWAGPAIQRFSDGTADTAAPHSHNCPAQDLSFRMMKAFIEAFIAKGGSSGWSAVDAASISVTAYGPSSFGVVKKGLTHTTGCAFSPSCKPGYSWVSTEYCWWGRRDWTCRVV